MTWEPLDLGTHPSKVTEEKYDCVWLVLHARKRKECFEDEAVQWIDWRMRGVVSRFVLDPNRKGPTFIPTQGAIPTPLLVLDLGKCDEESFFRACEGMKLKSIICIFEGPGGNVFKQALGSHPSREYPQNVFLSMGGEAKPHAG